MYTLNNFRVQTGSYEESYNPCCCCCCGSGGKKKKKKKPAPEPEPKPEPVSPCDCTVNCGPGEVCYTCVND